MTDCPRVGKLFGGCKFSPRYDIQGATDPVVWMFSSGRASPPAARSTYICDVCETCGKTLFRRKAGPATKPPEAP